MNVDQAIRKNCSHLSKSQQEDLRSLLFKHYKLFDGTLRTYYEGKMDTELQEGARPVHRRPYATPRVHLETFPRPYLSAIRFQVYDKD